MSTTKNLQFVAKDLSTDAVLLLTFDGEQQGIYSDFFPVAYKVIHFASQGAYTAQADFTSQIAFSAVDVQSGNVLPAKAYVQIAQGQHTRLFQENGALHFSTPTTLDDDTKKQLSLIGVLEEAVEAAINVPVKLIGAAANALTGAKPAANPQKTKTVSVVATNDTGSVQTIALGTHFTPSAMSPANNTTWIIDVVYSHGIKQPLTVFPDVGHGKSVATKFNSKLRAYVTSEYKESSIIRGPVQSPLILDVDILQLGASTVFQLKYDSASGQFTLIKE
ncbi:hypothetical protein V8B97DRAFT_1917352 [Scleroderma yunnanense]